MNQRESRKEERNDKSEIPIDALSINEHSAEVNVEDESRKEVFWHSSAIILGAALEKHFAKGFPCFPSSNSNGFFYEIFLKEQTVSQEDQEKLQQIVESYIQENLPFEKLVLPKQELLEVFKENEFKLRLLDRMDQQMIQVCRFGSFLEICEKPIVKEAGQIKAIKLLNVSSSYWSGDCEAESLQRISGISWPSDEMMKEWEKAQEEAAARDHRKIGLNQELFFFHPLSPACAFWYPKGALMYNRLIEFIRRQYRLRGFMEVITPNIYNSKLWEQSGHWQHYKEDMFVFDVEKEHFGLKPMNCPGHALMFANRLRSYNELPLRFADFGVLHRNESSGALSGLTRVRRFQIDDAHIFCRYDQIGSEIKAFLDFLEFTYEKVFGFTFNLNLSTRPEHYLGEIEVWDEAEAALKKVLDGSGRAWKVNAGDGAFYGPKIDITIQDALKRNHQCATVQLDFQMPIRFDLHYFDEKGERHRPVMIHRAILGSLERFFGIITESFAGKWPFWLSPRQAKIVCVHESFREYAREVKDKIYGSGFEVEFDENCAELMNRQIRDGQLAAFNFILVIGKREIANRSVNVRGRDNVVHGEIPIDVLVEKFEKFARNYVKDSEISFR
ncbi:unnamed protein product, partial [Mesorhabditis belari]|uniref:Probable threonine--tRNA ligase, cytoplasmic n=1 Tax=Mesorhabditis belari TaxID=2138241 RepID=A0AAF3FTC6_9BILA